MKSFQEESLFLPFELGSPPERLHFSSLPPSITRFFISNDGLFVRFFNLTLLIIASFVWTFWFGLVNFFLFSVRLIYIAQTGLLLLFALLQDSTMIFILFLPAPSVLGNILWSVLIGNFQKKKPNQTKYCVGNIFFKHPLKYPTLFSGPIYSSISIMAWIWMFKRQFGYMLIEPNINSKFYCRAYHISRHRFFSPPGFSARYVFLLIEWVLKYN